jgi:hypothetical protein
MFFIPYFLMLFIPSQSFPDMKRTHFKPINHKFFLMPPLAPTQNVPVTHLKINNPVHTSILSLFIHSTRPIIQTFKLIFTAARNNYMNILSSVIITSFCVANNNIYSKSNTLTVFTDHYCPIIANTIHSLGFFGNKIFFGSIVIAVTYFVVTHDDIQEKNRNFFFLHLMEPSDEFFDNIFWHLFILKRHFKRFHTDKPNP